MPKISHVRLEYTIYQGDHRETGRWFGLVHRGPLRIFKCTIENTNTKSEALSKLKEEYAKKPRTPDLATHGWHD